MQTLTNAANKFKRKPRRCEDTCYCGAYKFPHRAGSGKCSGPGEVICSACGDITEGEFMDFGIGAYEYWGSKGFDRNVQWVSKCCEADLLDNTPVKTNATPPSKDDYYDED